MATNSRKFGHVSIAVAAVLLHSVGVITWAQMQNPVPCADCTITWLSNSDVCGGAECQHGPENDPDCAAAVAALRTQHPEWSSTQIYLNACWETNGNQGNCKCFECGLVDGCEGYQAFRVADCGPQGANQAGSSCEVHMETTDPKATVYYSYQMVIVSGAGCIDFTGYEKRTRCGGRTDECGCVGPSACDIVFGTYSYRESADIEACGPSGGA